MRLSAIYGVLIAGLTLFDWVSKSQIRQLFGGERTLIPGVVRIQVVQNRGLFLGMFDNISGRQGYVLFLVFFVLALATLVAFAWRSSALKTRRHVGFACMISGALANGLDRLYHGHVLDFLQIGPLGVYNLADFALIVGAMIVLWDYWRSEPGEQAGYASDSF